jgi:hypothetical protein
MDLPENNLQETSRTEDLREECEDLRRQVNLLFGGLVVASCTLMLYLCLQAKRAAAELKLIQPQADQVLKAVEQDNAAAEGIYAKLAEFARTHPDFQNKIFYKYKMAGTNAPAAAPKK